MSDGELIHTRALRRAVATTPLRLAIVTNIPTPYRIPVYDLVSDDPGLDVRVMYFAEREFDREWMLETPRAPSSVLSSKTLRWRDRDIHFSSGVWRALSRMRPDVVLTNGFNPAHLIAYAWSVAHRVPHVAQTDGTPDLERRLGRMHRVVRRIESRGSKTTIAASDAGLRLLEQWGADPRTRYRSSLAVDNSAFEAAPDQVRDIDVLISGSLSERKNPLFGLRAAEAGAHRLGRRLVVAVVGDGPLRQDVEDFSRAAADDLDVIIAGFQQQADLPDWYRRAKLLLFPTREDAWGLVVNEASAAGVPQIVSPAAGAKELVDDGVSGYVRELDEAVWAGLVAEVLSNDERWASLSAAALQRVGDYTFERAARGMADAVHAAARRSGVSPHSFRGRE